MEIEYHSHKKLLSLTEPPKELVSESPMLVIISTNHVRINHPTKLTNLGTKQSPAHLQSSNVHGGRFAPGKTRVRTNPNTTSNIFTGYTYGQIAGKQ